MAAGAWVVLQWMIGCSAGGQGVMLATPAHIGGFVAGLLLQRPLLLWRYREGLGASPASDASAARCRRIVRLEQPVEVDDDIFHLGIVDRALGLAAPGVLGLGIAVEEADQVDRRRGRRSPGPAGP